MYGKNKNSGEDETEKYFADFAMRARSALEQLGQDNLKSYWIYYVDSKGKCNIEDPEAEIMFMMLPAGDPRDINFKNPN